MADLPPQLGGDGYSEDSPRVYPGLSDGTAVPRTDLGSGWEPAIVVNYPVEPSQHLDSEPPVRPGEPSPEPDRPAEIPLSDEPPPEIDLPSVPDNAPEVEPELPGTDEPGPGRSGASGPACRAGTRSCSAGAASRTDPARSRLDVSPARELSLFGWMQRIPRSNAPIASRTYDGKGVTVTSGRRAVVAAFMSDAGHAFDRERSHRRDRVVRIAAARWRRRGRRTLVRPL